ncbi:MAG: hypothetical protein LQ339_009043 [Xanthoria mediterranea]|nr:MAG: hypothetical protein LQ339_009043 [Xanthoria mediterranea]
MASRNGLPIYSATYSNVPVYEFNLEGNHVMRRRQDNWINATHILKVANLDKPARTRILEREVQKGIHEKVQGGYGKYQGTWVPLHEGRLLAERNGVLAKLLPFFDFVPGPISPPQAPKHQTAASNKGPKVPKPKKAALNSHTMPPPSQMSEDLYDHVSNQLNDDESMVHSEFGSDSFYNGEEDGTYGHPPGSRKRKRPDPAYFEQQHTLYADALLDYFMLSESDRLYRSDPPAVPDGFMVNKPIDEQGHTALHWGAAMGDTETVRMFISRGAHVDVPNVRGETPLIRAVLFTNNHEKETMPKIVDILLDTIMKRDKYGATVLHHVAMTTKSSSRKRSARYYLNVLLNKLGDMLSPGEFAHFLEARDNNGDTAVHIVARHNAKKCVREFQGRGVSFDIPNENGETAAQIMHHFHASRIEDITAIASSSPAQPAGGVHLNGHHNDPLRNSMKASLPGAASSQYETQSAQSFSTSFGPTVNDKALQVSLAMEDELQQMDASLVDATRLVHQTTHERNAVRQKTAQLTREDMAIGGDEEEAKRLSDEKDYLTGVCESMLEVEQYRNLHAEVSLREQQQSQAGAQMNGTAADDDGAASPEKIQAAYTLAGEQERRRELSRQLVQAQALAGMSEKGDIYKRLIAASVGVSVQEVADLVPDVLRELEVEKGDVELGLGFGKGVVGGGTGVVV